MLARTSKKSGPYGDLTYNTISIETLTLRFQIRGIIVRSGGTIPI